jgi:hypothetical protein
MFLNALFHVLLLQVCLPFSGSLPGVLAHQDVAPKQVHPKEPMCFRLLLLLLLLQVCLPTSGSLPSVSADQDVAECEAAAWKLQVHACALHILLLELLSVQVGHGGCVLLQTLGPPW